MAIADSREATFQGSLEGDIDVSTLTSRFIEEALRYCEDKAGYIGRDRVAAALRSEIPEIHDYFRYALASQVARYLARLDSSVVAVYIYCYGDAEEEGEERHCSITMPINIILHVRRKTAALSSMVDYLDEQLLGYYKRLVSPYGEKMGSLLDVQMVDDEDIARGVGFGVVLRSSYSKPLRLTLE